MLPDRVARLRICQEAMRWLNAPMRGSAARTRGSAPNSSKVVSAPMRNSPPERRMPFSAGRRLRTSTRRSGISSPLLHVQVGAAGDAHLRLCTGVGCRLPLPQRPQPLRDGREVRGNRSCGRQRRRAIASAGPVEPAAEPAVQRVSAVLQRAIPGAAAQVAAQGVFHVVEGEPLRFVQQQPVQRHHDAGRAEPALRAAVLDDGLLRGGEPGVQVASLDRDHVPAVHLRQRHQAGGDRLVADGIVCQLSDQDGAGAAVALLAALLGAGQPLAVAQEIQQQQPRRCGGVHPPVVEDETSARLPCANRRRSAQLLPERTHLSLAPGFRTPHSNTSYPNGSLKWSGSFRSDGE